MSKHLKLLTIAGVIRRRPEGSLVFCKINDRVALDLLAQAEQLMLDARRQQLDLYCSELNPLWALKLITSSAPRPLVCWPEVGAGGAATPNAAEVANLMLGLASSLDCPFRSGPFPLPGMGVTGNPCNGTCPRVGVSFPATGARLLSLISSCKKIVGG